MFGIKSNRKSIIRLIYAILLLTYICGGLFSLFISNTQNLNKSHVSLAILMGAIVSILLMKYRNHVQNEEHMANYLTKKRFLTITLSTFLIIYALTVMLIPYSIHISYYPVEYFALLSLMSVMVFIQAAFLDNITIKDSMLIILEIIILSTLLTASFLFLFPGCYGYDAPFHCGFIDSILTLGHLSTSSYYQNFPLFHILYVLISLIGGIAELKYVQMIVGFLQVVLLLFIFLLSANCFNRKIGLVSLMIVSLVPYVLVPRYTFFPGSFAAVFFPLVLFVALHKADARYTILFIIISLALLYIHPLILVVVMFTMGVILLLRYILDSDGLRLPIYSILFLAIAYIVHSDIAGKEGTSTFSNIVTSIKLGIESTDISSVSCATMIQQFNFTDVLLMESGYTILLFFGILGSFLILNSYCYNNHETSIVTDNVNNLILAVITLIFIPIPYVLAFTLPNSLPARWFVYVSIFIGIFASVAFIKIFEMRSNPIFKSVLIIVFFAIVFASTGISNVNPNNHIGPETFIERSALSHSELAANVFTTSLNLQSICGSSKQIGISYRLADHVSYINPDNYDSFNDNYVILRNYDMDHGFTIPRFGSGGKLVDIIIADDNFYNHLEVISHHVYENGEVRLYDGME